MKIGIITIDDDNNYGNRLQNYALEQHLRKHNFDISTIRIKKKKIDIKRIIKIIINYKNQWAFEKRQNNFKKFNKNINIEYVNSLKDSNVQAKDYIIVGSDQVWNPKFERLTSKELLIGIDPQKRISYAASFGINNLPKEYHNKTKNELKKFKAISVREDRGKEIVEELTHRKDIEVLIDPTMLLSAEEWQKVSTKPKQLNTDKYILNYFLGDLSNERKKEIERIAKENNCEIINILDKTSKFYTTGPSEFLYLEQNAFLICTDSFHSSVFAIIFNRPFLVFDREDKNIDKMNSRIDTLIKKLKLNHRIYKGKITKENLNHNYQEAYQILQKEKQKSIDFINKYTENN